MTSEKGIKNSEELVKKLIEDKNLLKDAYSTLVEENITLENVKIFDDVVSFLQVDPALISSTCLNLRKFCGKIFDINVVGKLLQFRVELDPEEIKDIIQACQEFFENYKEDDGDNPDKKSFLKIWRKKQKEEQVLKKNGKEKKK